MTWFTKDLIPINGAEEAVYKGIPTIKAVYILYRLYVVSLNLFRAEDFLALSALIFTTRYFR